MSGIDLERFAIEQNYPIIPCNLCGSQPNLQRQNIKAQIQEWEQRFPGRIQSMLSAMGNVAPSQLMDRELHDFSQTAAGARPSKKWKPASSGRPRQFESRSGAGLKL